MSKIKINLDSGVSLEKPLINAFKSGDNNYLILDNEMNGSMGLPIILVCKLVGNKVTKISDQNEWTQVKESLKQIIAGNKLDYISVGESINADDIYYTQLTLPVPSFDALKNAYQPVEVASTQTMETPTKEVTTQPLENSVMPDVVVPTSEPKMQQAEPVMPSVTPVSEPVVDQHVGNAVMPTEPVMPNVTPEVVAPMDLNMNQIVNPTPVVNTSVNEIPVSPQIPVMPETPAIEPVMSTVSEPVISEPASPVSVGSSLQAEMPVMPEVGTTIEPTPAVVNQAPVVEPVQPVTPVESAQVVTDTPVVEQSSILNEEMIKAQKDAFLEACSNMFDALVEQFKKNINQ